MRVYLRKTPLRSEDVARGHAPVCVRIVGADAADQAKPLQRCQMIVQSGDGHLCVLGQPRLQKEELAEIHYPYILQEFFDTVLDGKLSWISRLSSGGTQLRSDWSFSTAT